MPPDPYKLGEAISEYQVQVVDLLRGESINVTVNSSNLQLDFLKPFTSYEFKVFGSTSSWAGNLTDTISLKTQEDGRWSEINKVTFNLRRDAAKLKVPNCLRSVSLPPTRYTINEQRPSNNLLKGIFFFALTFNVVFKELRKQ